MLLWHSLLTVVLQSHCLSKRRAVAGRSTSFDLLLRRHREHKEGLLAARTRVPSGGEVPSPPPGQTSPLAAYSPPEIPSDALVSPLSPPLSTSRYAPRLFPTDLVFRPATWGAPSHDEELPTLPHPPRPAAVNPPLRVGW